MKKPSNSTSTVDLARLPRATLEAALVKARANPTANYELIEKLVYVMRPAGGRS